MATMRAAEMFRRTASAGIAAAAVVLTLGAPATGARPTCFGEKATIVGKKGQNVIKGTRGRDVIVGTPGRDAIKARAGSDLVCARGGNDIVRGGPGTDSLDGGAGDDILRGGKGSQDWLNGGPGNDRLDGGKGSFDAVLYVAAPKGVTVDLADGTATGQGKDTLSNVSDVFGSPHDDVLLGDDDEGGNGFFPGAGDDEVDGRGGGIDLVLLTYAEGAVTIDLTAGTATGEGTDTLTEIEGGRGSEKGDTLTGDADPNFLYGGRGRDVIAGRAGNDYLDGGPGVDTLDGGEGFDVCVNGENVVNCDDQGSALARSLERPRALHALRLVLR